MAETGTTTEDILRLAQQLSGPDQQAPPQMQVARPSTVVGLLGSALGGGPSGNVGLTEAQADAEGRSAMLNAGLNMLEASGYSRRRRSLGEIVAKGMRGAQGAIGDYESQLAARQAAAQQMQQQQIENRFKGLEGATKLGELQQKLRSLQTVGGMTLDGKSSGGGGGSGGEDIYGLPKEQFLAAVAKRESGGNPTAKNYVWEADPTAYERGATASGKYQMVNSTWRTAATAAGIDVSKYPTARDAPEALQDQAASKLYDMQGTQPWDKSKWGKDWVKGEGGKYTLQPTGGGAGGGGGPPAPATPTTPPATRTATPAAPVSPFGAGAFAPPTRSVAAAPETTATAPNVPTNLVPPVRTPQTVAAAAVAARTGKPAPIEGTDGLYALPGGGVGPGPGAGGLGRRAAADAIIEGQRTAATTLPPQDAVLAAGPAAGGGAVPGASVEAPVSAFGGGAFASRPPAMVGGAPPAGPVPAPQQPPATPQPPEPKIIPQSATQQPAGDQGFQYKPSALPDELKQYTTKELQPQQLKDLQARRAEARTAFDQAKSIGNTEDMRKARERLAQTDKDEADLLQTQSKDVQEMVRTFYGKDFDAQRKDYDDRQTHARALEIEGLKLKNATELEQTKTGLASGSKIMDGLYAKSVGSQKKVDDLDLLRVVSAGVDDDGLARRLSTMRWGDTTAANKIATWGLTSDDFKDKVGRINQLQAMINNTVTSMRQGMSMGPLSDRDLSFIQAMTPDMYQNKATRDGVIKLLREMAIRESRYANEVGRLWDDGKGMKMNDALARASDKMEKENPIIPQISDVDSADPTKFRDFVKKHKLEHGAIIRDEKGNLGTLELGGR